ncbi:MAG: DUF1127 domain-containing protein [Neomegalonema sp.]|nr:DUF1127 domain-containing protein [Neomegalonema sp.]
MADIALNSLPVGASVERKSSADRWAFLRIFENIARVRYATELAQLTDTQLKDMGLTRDQIVEHAFSIELR